VIPVDELDARSFQGLLDGIEIGGPEHQHTHLEIHHGYRGHDRSSGKLGLRHGDEYAPLGIGQN
jgi:hypothetical protein